MNQFLSAVRLAARNLALHKLRSLLTVLGLIFGVASVVAMLAITEGASVEAQRQIAALGATNIIVRSKKPTDEVKPSGNNDSFIFGYGLTDEDFERMTQTVPTVLRATPAREFHQMVRYLDREQDCRVVGATPNAAKLGALELRRGRFITDVDQRQFANVAVLGDEVAKILFGPNDPIGRAVRVGDNHFYRVVGILSPKAAQSALGGATPPDVNKDVYIPLSTNRARFGDVIFSERQGTFNAERIELSQVTVAVDAVENVKATAHVLTSLMTQFHPKKDFEIAVPLELLEKAEATKRIFNLVLGSIAGISLLVGGIGIMNIMLATVTERTREIGIRRALGAKRRDITRQFLIETAVMSATGGLIGVLLGVGTPPLVSRFSGLPIVVQPWSPILAFLIALVIGVGFGVYPARRAAMMDPIEALRHE